MKCVGTNASGDASAAAKEMQGGAKKIFEKTVGNMLHHAPKKKGCLKEF
jgi:hypothetical protein